jgi:Rrf2 family iron-sulfur cluster assembly transcriptional regulator
MFFSKRCNHGLRALLYLASREATGTYVSIRDIARDLEIPFHFLSKIFQDMRDAGLVEATRGVSGGVRLSVPAKDLDVLRVVDVLEGENFLHGCVLGFEECSGKNPCALHGQWAETRANLQKMFANQSLAQVAERTATRTGRSRARL